MGRKSTKLVLRKEESTEGRIFEIDRFRLV